jgi:hypothetical protein
MKAFSLSLARPGQTPREHQLKQLKQLQATQLNAPMISFDSRRSEL